MFYETQRRKEMGKGLLEDFTLYALKPHWVFSRNFGREIIFLILVAQLLFSLSSLATLSGYF